MNAPSFVVDPGRDAGTARQSLIRKLAAIYGLELTTVERRTNDLVERIRLFAPLSAHPFHTPDGNLRTPVADAIEHALDLGESTTGTRVYMTDEHHWTQIRADPASTAWGVTAWQDTPHGPAPTRVFRVKLIQRAEYLATDMTRRPSADLARYHPTVATFEQQRW